MAVSAPQPMTIRDSGVYLRRTTPIYRFKVTSQRDPNVAYDCEVVSGRTAYTVRCSCKAASFGNDCAHRRRLIAFLGIQREVAA